MAKSADAFRSIGEVARLIGVAPHVLRYWETQFPQLAPVKRADGRRYYRPDDVKLAAGLCEVMRDDGMTARGALRLMAEDRGAALRARGAERVQTLLAAEAEGGTAPKKAPAPRRKSAKFGEMPLFGDELDAGKATGAVVGEGEAGLEADARTLTASGGDATPVAPAASVAAAPAAASPAAPRHSSAARGPLPARIAALTRRIGDLPAAGRADLRPLAAALRAAIERAH